MYCSKNQILPSYFKMYKMFHKGQNLKLQYIQFPLEVKHAFIYFHPYIPKKHSFTIPNLFDVKPTPTHSPLSKVKYLTIKCFGYFQMSLLLFKPAVPLSSLKLENISSSSCFCKWGIIFFILCYLQVLEKKHMVYSKKKMFTSCHLIFSPWFYQLHFRY